MAIIWKKLAYDEDLHTQNEDTALGAQSENLNMNTHKIVGVVDPTANQEVATKKYVDDNSGGGGNVPAGSQGDMLYKGASAWLAGKMFFNADAYGTHATEAALDAVIAAAVAAGGGTIYVSSGTWTVANACPTISVPITFLGDGFTSKIVTTSTTANIFNITSSNPVHFANLYIEGPGKATSNASGISIDTASTANRQSSFTNLFIAGFYYGIDFVDAFSWKMDHCYVVENVNGIRVKDVLSPDAGDQLVIGCTFDKSAADLTGTAIRIESGGGLKVIGTKILHHQYGIDLNVASGINTSVLLVTGCSLEGQGASGWAIRLGNTGTGQYHKASITGNQFNTTTQGIQINGTTDNTVGHIVISGNIMDNAGITIVNGANIHIASNCIINGSSITYAIDNQGGINVSQIGNYFANFSPGAAINGSFDGVSTENKVPKIKLNRASVGAWGMYVNPSDSLVIGDEVSGSGITITNAGNLTATGSCCGADYVFEDGYKLKTLPELSAYVGQNESLPGITFTNNDNIDFNLAIEELTVKTEEQALYILQLHERLKTLEIEKA